LISMTPDYPYQARPNPRLRRLGRSSATSIGTALGSWKHPGVDKSLRGLMERNVPNNSKGSISAQIMSGSEISPAFYSTDMM
jgi:hypothetical protein